MSLICLGPGLSGSAPTRQVSASGSVGRFSFPQASSGGRGRPAGPLVPPFSPRTNRPYALEEEAPELGHVGEARSLGDRHTIPEAH